MFGTLKHIPKSGTGLANYAFIKGEDGKEHFLHASGLIEHWDELKEVLNTKKVVRLEFEVVESPRGTRANNARIIYE